MKKLSKKNVIILCVSLLIFISIVVGCFGIMKKSLKKESSSLETVELLNSNNISENLTLIKQNTVRITNEVNDYEVVGTGFFLTNGYLVTNSHVVDIKGKISIEFYDGTTSSATIFSNDILSDVALLNVEDINALALPIQQENSIEISDDLYAVGYGLDLLGDATITKGILSACREAQNIKYIQTDATVTKGFSGGPLLDNSGKVVGMTSLATENAGMTFAIAQESLAGIVTSLVENPTVEYIENERPKNAISDLLVEVGIVIDDIYEEQDLLNKSHNEKDELDNNEPENKKNSEAETNNNTNDKNEKKEIETNKLSSDSSLKSLEVKGYNINFNNAVTSYTITITGGETSLTILPETNHARARYSIEGNQTLVEGNNKVTVTVEAEDGNKTIYSITVVKPMTTFNRAEGIILGLDTKYSNAMQQNCFHLFWDYKDGDGIRVYPETQLNIISSIKVEVFAGWGDMDTLIDTNGKQIRLLKTYDISNPTINQQTVEIPINEIRSLLCDEDYEGGVYNGADLTFRVSIQTKHQGTFSQITPWGLEKK